MATTKDVYVLEADAQLKALQDVVKALQDIASASKDAGDSADSASSGADKAESAFSRLSTGAMGLFAGLQLVETGLSAIGKITDFAAGLLEGQAQLGLLEAQTGLTGDALLGLRDSADEVFMAGWGENLDEVTQAMSSVKNITGLTGDELENLTTNALILSQAFDKDIGESTRAANVIMKQFGLDGEDAFDLLTRGLQVTGDPADDLLDTFNEYSGNFAQMGLSGEQALNLINQSMQAGARNTDDVADALREFQIRLMDGTSTEAIEGLSLETQNVFDLFQDGGTEAASVLESILYDLNQIEDPIARNAAGVQIFGTKWEDMGEDAILAMDLTSDSLGEVEGATDKAGDAMSKGLLPTLESAKRTLLTTFQRGLEPLAFAFADKLTPAVQDFAAFLETDGIPALIDIAESLADGAMTVLEFGDNIITSLGGTDAIFSTLSEGVASVADFITNLSPETLAVFGAVLAGVVVPALVSMIATAAVAAAPFVLLGAAVAGVAYIIENNMFGAKDAIASVLDTLGGLLDSATTAISGVIAAFETGGFDAAADFILDGISAGLVDLATWAKTSIIDPIAAGVTDPANQAAFLNTLSGIMAGISTGVVDFATWSMTNIITPIATAVSDPANQAAFLSTMETIFMGIAQVQYDVASWALTNIISPIASELTNTANYEGFLSVLWTIFSSIGSGIIDAALFANDKILSPLASAISDPANQAAFLNGLSSIMGGIAAGAVDFLGWVNTNILTPMASVFTAENVAMAFSAIGDVGSSIYDAIAATLPDATAWAQANIGDPLKSAIKSAILSLFGTLNSGLPDSIAWTLGTVKINFPRPLPDVDWNFGTIDFPLPANPFPTSLAGFASGGSFTVPGSGNSDMPTLLGLTPGEEVNVVRKSDVGRGGGSGSGVTVPVVLQLDGRTIFEVMQQVEMTRA